MSQRHSSALPVRSVDGFQRRPHLPSSEQVPPKSARARPMRKMRSLPAPLKTILLALVGLVAGMTILTYQLFGELTLITYGIIAFIRHIPSRTSFTLAVISMLCIPLTEILGRIELSLAFASYTFLLMLIGAFCLSAELRRSN